MCRRRWRTEGRCSDVAPADERPDDRALWWVGPSGGQQILTFRDLSRRSNQVANAMARLGLRRGDQVMLSLPSVVPWWESMVGLTKADMVAIPTTALLTGKDIVYRVESAEIDGVITDATGAEKIDAVAATLPGLRVKVQVGGASRTGWTDYDQVVDSAPVAHAPLQTPADGPALTYFTSGTTGPPKMVLHSHASFGLG